MSDDTPKIPIPEDVLSSLADALSEELYIRVKTGTASAADLQAARQWLNDNNVAADPKRNKPLQKLGHAVDNLSTLPFEEDGTPTKKAH